VDDLVDARERDLVLGGQLAETLQRRNGRIMRRREAFVEGDLARTVVVEYEVGEGAPDIEADAVFHLLPDATQDSVFVPENVDFQYASRRPIFKRFAGSR
jgi:hypothetical protein